MPQIVVLTGRTCNGKTHLTRSLNEEFGYEVVDTSALLIADAESRGLPQDRIALQKLGDQLDQETSFRWVFDAVVARTKSSRTPMVGDCIRNAGQLAHFRQSTDLDVVHVHLYAPDAVLEERFKKRSASASGGDTALSREQADLIKQEKDIESFRADADVRIFTGRTEHGDTFVRVAGHLGLYAPPQIRCVDVLVGGQFGSEGKGHVAAYLAREYDVLVRVGGPNAGHTVSGRTGVYTYHHLPSGCQDTDAEVLIGPGATLYVPSLLKEISECRLGPDRLFIDPQAMIITDADRESEGEIKKGIASTGSGSGYAAARRIMNRLPGKTKLACDIPELSPFVGLSAPYRGATLQRLERAYRDGKSILLEGTQGSGLSLFHGYYPFVTSRDTNVAGCLAEAGISPSRVRRVLMVIRPTPIRVDNPSEGTSGPLRLEVDFDRVANDAKLDAT
jgi:adenylosuccinate synthase